MSRLHPMTVTDRTAATEAEFRSRIAPFEAAPTPPEVREARVVEEVARAIDEARDAHGPFYFPCKCGWEAGFGAGWEDRGDRHQLLSIAAAAVAAYRAAQDGGAEEAVRRVEAVHVRSKALFMTDRCDLDDELWPCRTVAALAPQAGDGAR